MWLLDTSVCVVLMHHGGGDLVEPDDLPPEDVDAFR